MKVSKRFVSQKTDLLSVIRLDARIIVRWTKMEMRFEIKRGKKKKKKKRKSNLVSLFGTIFYANVTRNETKSSLNQRLRIEGGDKENTVASNNTPYGIRGAFPRFALSYPEDPMSALSCRPIAS